MCRLDQAIGDLFDLLDDRPRLDHVGFGLWRGPRCRPALPRSFSCSGLMATICRRPNGPVWQPLMANAPGGDDADQDRHQHLHDSWIEGPLAVEHWFAAWVSPSSEKPLPQPLPCEERGARQQTEDTLFCSPLLSGEGLGEGFFLPLRFLPVVGIVAGLPRGSDSSGAFCRRLTGTPLYVVQSDPEMETNDAFSGRMPATPAAVLATTPAPARRAITSGYRPTPCTWPIWPTFTSIPSASTPASAARSSSVRTATLGAIGCTTIGSSEPAARGRTWTSLTAVPWCADGQSPGKGFPGNWPSWERSILRALGRISRPARRPGRPAPSSGALCAMRRQKDDDEIALLRRCMRALTEAGHAYRAQCPSPA